jgi:hypothetical protein
VHFKGIAEIQVSINMPFLVRQVNILRILYMAMSKVNGGSKNVRLCQKWVQTASDSVDDELKGFILEEKYNHMRF